MVNLICVDYWASVSKRTVSSNVVVIVGNRYTRTNWHASALVGDVAVVVVMTTSPLPPCSVVLIVKQYYVCSDYEPSLQAKMIMIPVLSLIPSSASIDCVTLINKSQYYKL